MRKTKPRERLQWYDDAFQSGVLVIRKDLLNPEKFIPENIKDEQPQRRLQLFDNAIDKRVLVLSDEAINYAINEAMSKAQRRFK